MRSALELGRGRPAAALTSASEALREFGEPSSGDAPAFAGVIAEAHRCAGAALARLERLPDALGEFEAAVREARDHLDASPPAPPYATGISPPGALLRSLLALAQTHAAVREFETAIELYAGAVETVRTHPALRRQHFDEALGARVQLARALCERSKRRRALGKTEESGSDIEAAGALLAEAAAEIAGTDRPQARPSAGASASFHSAAGHHHLVAQRPAEALEAFNEQRAAAERAAPRDDGMVADADAGAAQALFDLAKPAAALERSNAALDGLTRDDRSWVRSAALRTRAAALRALGKLDAAYDALVERDEQRDRLEAAGAANAGDLVARIQVERARAETDSQRRFTRTLETLGDSGRHILAQLDAAVIVRLFAEHALALLAAQAVTVWLVDADGAALQLRLGLAGGRPFSSAPIPIGDPRSLAAAAFRERRAIAYAAGAGTDRRAIFEPLVAADRTLGVASIHADGAEPFGENALSVFRVLTGYAATALANASTYAALEQTAHALVATQSELTARTAEYERLSMTDMLTGLPNRRQLNDRARVEVAAMRRDGHQLSVAIFDLDHFKLVNDTYGHAAGDTVLQHVARVAKDGLRPADLIARIGGEEFALLLPGAGSTVALTIAERIRANLAEAAVATAGATISITASFGVATFAAQPESFEDVLARADRAMYAAKQAGRDRVHAAPDLA